MTAYPYCNLIPHGDEQTALVTVNCAVYNNNSLLEIWYFQPSSTVRRNSASKNSLCVYLFSTSHLVSIQISTCLKKSYLIIVCGLGMVGGEGSIKYALGSFEGYNSTSNSAAIGQGWVRGMISLDNALAYNTILPFLKKSYAIPWTYDMKAKQLFPLYFANKHLELHVLDICKS